MKRIIEEVSGQRDQHVELAKLRGNSHAAGDLRSSSARSLSMA